MTDRADLVIVGCGTIGGWASWFARSDGAGRVVVVERGTVGNGASSRAAGIVRAQGGTPVAVELGRWSIDFYRRQPALIGTDSGFRELGYLLLAVTEADERAARERMLMQKGHGLAVRWVDAAEAARLSGTLAATGYRGATYLEGDGHIDPPRNVLAYSLAIRSAGVELRERTAFTSLVTESRRGATRVVGIETSGGRIDTSRVILTGGPMLAEVGTAAGVRIPAGAARHTVCILEPHAAFAEAQPMVFDIGEGLYWRNEDGGLLFGWSNPNEPPGIARNIDWSFHDRMRARLDTLVPVTRGLGIRKMWAATIDFTPDHLPILGPALRDGQPIEGVVVASAGGHGMMWGPAVARVAADLALHGATELVDVSELGLDRFDAEGRSRLAADPIALPFPSRT
jgi:sarcosine oxidase, subunit beta